jgi:hypothetical protein
MKPETDAVFAKMVKLIDSLKVHSGHGGRVHQAEKKQFVSSLKVPRWLGDCTELAMDGRSLVDSFPRN